MSGILVKGVTPTGESTALSVDGSGGLVSGLGIPTHDFVANTYTGQNLTQAVYKKGGPEGEVVATLTMTYDENGNLLTTART